MSFIMTIVGVGVIAVSLIYGLNLYDDSNPSDDPLGLIGNPIDSFKRNLAYIVWVVGIVLGFIALGIGKIIDILEELKKSKTENQTQTKEE